jgi:hypothetical protein
LSYEKDLISWKDVDVIFNTLAWVLPLDAKGVSLFTRREPEFANMFRYDEVRDFVSN